MHKAPEPGTMNPKSILRPPKLRAAGTEKKERMPHGSNCSTTSFSSWQCRRWHMCSVSTIPKGGRIAIGLLMTVGWVWAGHTVYAARFDTDDLVYRLFTFLQMFAVMGMGIQVRMPLMERAAVSASPISGPRSFSSSGWRGPSIMSVKHVSLTASISSVSASVQEYGGLAPVASGPSVGPVDTELDG